MQVFSCEICEILNKFLVEVLKRSKYPKAKHFWNFLKINQKTQQSKCAERDLFQRFPSSRNELIGKKIN